MTLRIITALVFFSIERDDRDGGDGMNKSAAGEEGKGEGEGAAVDVERRRGRDAWRPVSKAVVLLLAPASSVSSVVAVDGVVVLLLPLLLLLLLLRCRFAKSSVFLVPRRPPQQ